MITLILFITSTAILNVIRGFSLEDYVSDKYSTPAAIFDMIFTSKVITSTLTGVSSYFLLNIGIIPAALVALSVLIWAIPAWGKYIASILTGVLYNKIAILREEDLITKVISKVFPRDISALTYGVAALSIRGLYLSVLPAFLAIYTQNFIVLSLALFPASQGIIYYAAARLLKDYNVDTFKVLNLSWTLGEFLYRLFIGVFIIYNIILGGLI